MSSTSSSRGSDLILQVTPSPFNSLGDKIPQESGASPMHARANSLDPVENFRGTPRNAHLNAPHFFMFTMSSVQSTVRGRDFAFKIDLEVMYFHILIHPDSQKYLRFIFMNKVNQFRILPFGLNTTQQVFARTYLG